MMFRKERTAIQRAADSLSDGSRNILGLLYGVVVLAVTALVVACVALGRVHHD